MSAIQSQQHYPLFQQNGSATEAAPDARLARLLDDHAPLAPVPLCPELSAFTARDLTTIWEAAERLVREPVPSPFWAYPWPGGAALARVLLDHPEWVRGRSVLDVGCGGGVAALAAARCGAARVVANDIDPLALAVTRLAAERQGLDLEILAGDLTAPDPYAEVPDAAASGTRAPAAVTPPQAETFDVVLCGDVAYERSVTPRVRAFLVARAAAGALVLLADPGRAYFDDAGLDEIGRWPIAVPKDVEGVTERVAAVYRCRS